jgi:hypothetical protein
MEQLICFGTVKDEPMPCEEEEEKRGGGGGGGGCDD